MEVRVLLLQLKVKYGRRSSVGLERQIVALEVASSNLVVYPLMVKVPVSCRAIRFPDLFLNKEITSAKNSGQSPLTGNGNGQMPT